MRVPSFICSAPKSVIISSDNRSSIIPSMVSQYSGFGSDGSSSLKFGSNKVLRHSISYFSLSIMTVAAPLSAGFNVMDLSFDKWMRAFL